MSWSVSMVGDPHCCCRKGENSTDEIRRCRNLRGNAIKGKILDVIETCLSAFPSRDHPVEVSASEASKHRCSKAGNCGKSTASDGQNRSGDSSSNRKICRGNPSRAADHAPKACTSNRP